MKKSIFDKKMENPKFKTVYDKMSTGMNMGERVALLRYKANWKYLMYKTDEYLCPKRAHPKAKYS